MPFVGAHAGDLDDTVEAEGGDDVVGAAVVERQVYAPIAAPHPSATSAAVSRHTSEAEVEGAARAG